MTAIDSNTSPARPASRMKGGGASSIPDAPILVKRQATPKPPIPKIRQVRRNKGAARSHLIGSHHSQVCCRSSKEARRFIEFGETLTHL